MGPQALQPWQHIAVLRQFDLCLGTGSLCAHGKDVEDERCAVEDLHLQFVFDIPYLFGREFIIENHHADFAFSILFGEDVLFDFLQFSLAHVCRLVGSCHTLRETLHGDGACGIGEKFQFVKVFLGLGLVLLLGNESYQNGGFIPESILDEALRNAWRYYESLSAGVEYKTVLCDGNYIVYAAYKL